MAAGGGRQAVALEFQKALQAAWQASGYVCSERVQLFSGEPVPLLEQHGQLHLDDATRVLLLQNSVRPVEWTGPERKGLGGRRMAQTKPGTLLRR
jgi:hypothetical protein